MSESNPIEQEETMTISFESYRLPGESYEVYRLRRKIANKAMKIYIKGERVSYEQHMIQKQIKEQEKLKKKNKNNG